MGKYINGKLVKDSEHTEAMAAGKKVAEQWRKDHATEQPVVMRVYDEKTERWVVTGRTEEMVIEQPNFTVRRYSDGTIRTDSRSPQPQPPAPAPVTADSRYSYSPEDMNQLRSTEGKAAVQVSDKGMTVTGPAAAAPSRPGRGAWEPQRPYVPRSE